MIEFLQRSLILKISKGLQCKRTINKKIDDNLSIITLTLMLM